MAFEGKLMIRFVFVLMPSVSCWIAAHDWIHILRKFQACKGNITILSSRQLLPYHFTELEPLKPSISALWGSTCGELLVAWRSRHMAITTSGGCGGCNVIWVSSLDTPCKAAMEAHDDEALSVRPVSGYHASGRDWHWGSGFAGGWNGSEI